MFGAGPSLSVIGVAEVPGSSGFDGLMAASAVDQSGVDPRPPPFTFDLMM